MNENAIIIGGIFGFSAILLGAFGAHLLKKKAKFTAVTEF